MGSLPVLARVKFKSHHNCRALLVGSGFRVGIFLAEHTTTPHGALLLTSHARQDKSQLAGSKLIAWTFWGFVGNYILYLD